MDPSSSIYQNLSQNLSMILANTRTVSLPSSEPPSRIAARITQEAAERPEFKLYSTIRALETQNQALKGVIHRHAPHILQSIVEQITTIVQRDPSLQEFFYTNFKLKENVTYAQILDRLLQNMQSANTSLITDGLSPEPEKLSASYRTLQALLVDYYYLLENQGQEPALLSNLVSIKTFTGGRSTTEHSTAYQVGQALGQTIYFSGTVFYHIISLSLTTIRTLCLAVNTLPRLSPINILMSP